MRCDDTRDDEIEWPSSDKHLLDFLIQLRFGLGTRSSFVRFLHAIFKTAGVHTIALL